MGSSGRSAVPYLGGLTPKRTSSRAPQPSLSISPWSLLCFLFLLAGTGLHVPYYWIACPVTD